MQIQQFRNYNLRIKISVKKLLIFAYVSWLLNPDPDRYYNADPDAGNPLAPLMRIHADPDP
jgi:hypothetical protein